MGSVKKQVRDLKDGDIFYVLFDSESKHYNNMDFFGIHYDLSGTDQIFILDDSCNCVHEGTLFVNGGHEIYLSPNDYVYVLGHYSELIKNIK